MTLQGIDISSWQSGIDLSVVPCDFVIVKATQGAYYINPDCSRAVEQARGLGKLFGIYHYIDGSGAVAEADYFLDNIANWVGKGMICLDWESGDNSAWGNEDYLRQVAQRIIDRTGIPPMIYVQQSRMAAVQPVANALNCGLWIAQYGDMNPTGYQDAPWNEDAYDCAMRQYASTGRLNGYSGNLDLNKFYGDAAAWQAYAHSNEEVNVKPVEPSAPKPSAPTTNGGDVTVTYEGRVGNTWLGEITNFNNTDGNGYIGIPGQGMNAIRVKVSRGSCWYKVHTVGGGWLPAVSGYDRNDYNNGYAGNGSLIDGFQMYYTTPAGESYKYAWYRSQTSKRNGYLPAVCDDGDFAGILGEPMDRLQISISANNPF